MKEKISNYYKNHKDAIVGTGMLVGIVVFGYAITIPYLLILDRLGFNVKKGADKI